MRDSILQEGYYPTGITRLQAFLGAILQDDRDIRYQDTATLMFAFFMEYIVKTNPVTTSPDAQRLSPLRFLQRSFSEAFNPGYLEKSELLTWLLETVIPELDNAVDMEEIFCHPKLQTSGIAPASRLLGLLNQENQLRTSEEILNEGTKIFETERGFLGTGPRWMDVGDELWALDRCSCLALIRKDGDFPLFVGICFVVGLMGGQKLMSFIRDQN